MRGRAQCRLKTQRTRMGSPARHGLFSIISITVRAKQSKGMQGHISTSSQLDKEPTALLLQQFQTAQRRRVCRHLRV